MLLGVVDRCLKRKFVNSLKVGFIHRSRDSSDSVFGHVKSKSLKSPT
jgi:hypothetical protein